MLPAGEHVREVYLHQGGLIDVVKDAGPLLIDCSTIDVDSARTVTAAAEAAGLAMLDAPVSGGTAGAQNGTLTFMVGGTEEAFARGKPVLEAMGKNIFHAGGPGAGQAVKICNNMMLAINMVGVSEGFLLAQKLGLDWDKLHQICATATANSWALSNYCPAPGPVPAAPSNRDYAPGFAAALMVKDVKLSQAAAEATGVAHAARRQGTELLPAGRRCRATAARISPWCSAGWRSRNATPDIRRPAAEACLEKLHDGASRSQPGHDAHGAPRAPDDGSRTLCHAFKLR